MPSTSVPSTLSERSAGRLVYFAAQPENVPRLRTVLDEYAVSAEIVHVTSRLELELAAAGSGVHLVVADDGSATSPAVAALEFAFAVEPRIPFICIGDSEEPGKAGQWVAAGADDYVPRHLGWRLAAAIRIGLCTGKNLAEQNRAHQRHRAMTRLLQAVQELSLARDLSAIQMIVRRAARDLTGADGATFVLRDGDLCFYADEDAIGPLWKGQRFPMSACISGWVMTHGESVVIENIFADERVPLEAYHSTFVRSLLMVPIRKEGPVGAIGNYWASHRRATPEDIELLQALANTTAVAMENIGVYAKMEQRVKDRTQQLELANRELETFSYTVSHDLRAPITAILGFAQLLTETLGDTAPEDIRDYCGRIVQQSFRMSGLIQDLLRLSQVAQIALSRQAVNMTTMAKDIASKIRLAEPRRQIEVSIADSLCVNADSALVRIMLENLFSNAWKYTGKVPHAAIEFGCKGELTRTPTFFVRDNGAGFDPQKAARLFGAFQRLHEQEEFPGVGVGLATVQRIVTKHGGRIWAEGAVGKGATFYFTLPHRASNEALPT